MVYDENILDIDNINNFVKLKNLKIFCQLVFDDLQFLVKRFYYGLLCDFVSKQE